MFYSAIIDPIDEQDTHICDLHTQSSNCPEKPERVQNIRKALQENNLYNTIEYRLPTQSELELVHTPVYIQHVKNTCKTGGFISKNSEVSVNSWGSWTAIEAAAGAVLSAVDTVLDEKSVIKRVYCNIRPPGHHAYSNKGMGFCIFNNVAIGAKYALSKWSETIKKTVIIDWDVHHGNGTQDIFEDDQNVMYISLHQSEWWPFTGKKEETGDHNQVVNVPVMAGASDEFYLNMWKVLRKRIKQFSPNMVFISCGFDAHTADPLAEVDLTTDFYGKITKKVVNFANKYCEGRVISVLEGGYNLDVLGEVAVAHVKNLE